MSAVSERRSPATALAPAPATSNETTSGSAVAADRTATTTSRPSTASASQPERYWRPVVSRAGSAPPARGTRHSSQLPSMGAVNRTEAPSADIANRAPSPSVRSLFIAASGLSSLEASRSVPPPLPASDPSAANRQIPVRYPPRGNRSPIATIAAPSRVHAGASKPASSPDATAVTAPVATSTVNTMER